MVQMRTALGGIPVSRAMVTEFERLSPDDPVSRAVQLILAGSQRDFPVEDDGRVVGILTRDAVLAALANGRSQDPAHRVMTRDFEIAEANDMLEKASAQLQACGCHTMPVQRTGELVGLLTMDNLGEFLMVRQAMLQARGRGRAPLAA
jgi:predicted transcriptional regulator